MNMEKCRWEESCGHEYCNLTDCPEYEAKPMTNADRIRAMTDEELAAVIMCPYDCDSDMCLLNGTCLDCCVKWLKQPVKEDVG